MILRSRARRVLSALFLLCGACGNRGDRTVVVGTSNQGSYSIKSETNPLDSLPPETQGVSSGPTEKELAQQRHIEELETKQKALQAEIERLKHEK